MDYIEVEMDFNPVEPWRDIAISEMGEEGFDSFVETKTGVKGYIPEKHFSQEWAESYGQREYVKNIEWKKIEDQNWNAKWESNFEPVIIEDQIVIKAPFHNQSFDAPIVVTIQPQMSFGTGHHQTTWMMSKRLNEIDLDGKEVLDMGTGTGVLAILAEIKGAKYVYAPDIDEWSFNNAIENIALNDCSNIEVALGDHQLLAGKIFDVIAANINKNVLIEQFSVYSRCLKPEGKLLISGFFATDQEDLKKVANENGFIFEDTLTKDGWAMMQFKKA
ncbi:50S ribosomal protein L11 methyltransferase [Paracrocinitomix mangrovi]|uniref:50S ribosomal protein L11 methyltransferase n=1 Tax=Paracrocinitomix mangrovi TaxID=2862509 RepID=UPI001C8E1F2B|nr:50S ribosomal protein L11 methyltransferase [Paracrocinitomix mangrovi]UKN01588.1 50S ribosomal protein L11 methyltransferase [Paracrocinitomix mangrovi]